MKNTSKTFKDVESAARYLSGDIIGKLTALGADIRRIETNDPVEAVAAG